MSFGTRVLQLANGVGLKVERANDYIATLLFNSNFRVYPLHIVPFSDVWEFSVQSLISFDKEDEFPQFILAMLMSRNSKSKRGFWCIESLGGKYCLSAMFNAPETSLTAAEFNRVCSALVSEVTAIEQAVKQALQ